MYNDFFVGMIVTIGDEHLRVITVADDHIIVDGYDQYWGYAGRPERIDAADVDAVVEYDGAPATNQIGA